LLRRKAQIVFSKIIFKSTQRDNLVGRSSGRFEDALTSTSSSAKKREGEEKE
jgi:hypothetical protein